MTMTKREATSSSRVKNSMMMMMFSVDIYNNHQCYVVVERFKFAQVAMEILLFID